MAGESPFTVVGNLTADPELRFTPSGTAVANFTVASTPRTYNKQSSAWEDGETMFLRCSVWRDFAENVAESLTKGMRVIVKGNLKARTYETSAGEKRTSFEIDAQSVGPDLWSATAKVTKANRSGGGQQPQAATSQATSQSGGNEWDTPSESSSAGSDPWGSPGADNSANDPWA